MTQLNMIVAVAQNDVIGKNGALPWRISEDLKVFKELTMGGVLFVGKNTAATLPPLKGREVITLDRHNNTIANIKAFADIYNGWKDKKLWLIGGAAIYNAALEMNAVDKVYLTRIHREYDGDTYFTTKQFVPESKIWTLTSAKTLKEYDPLVILEEWEKY